MSHKIRRLRFALDLHPNESVPGALARSVAAHHLEKLNIVLKEAGLGGKYAGLNQMASPADIIAISNVIGCDSAVLGAGIGLRLIEPGSRQLAHLVSFGDLAIPRSYLQLHRRRISPLTLRQLPYHRADWLVAMLPYCPVSLECLVDECAFCAHKLGWVRSLGVGVCEKCGEEVRPNHCKPLPEDIVSDYRIFANMISFDRGCRANTLAKLPLRLANLPASDLVRLAVRFGLDCTTDSDAEPRAWQTRTAALSAEKIARIVARGAYILRTWPKGIQEWASEFVNAGGLDRPQELRLRLKRIGLGDSCFGAQSGLLQEVFPDWTAKTSFTVTPEPRRYAYREARERIPNFGTHMVALRRAGILPYVTVNKPGSTPAYLYCAKFIDEFATLATGSISQREVERVLKLPAYAVEQFYCTNLLKRAEHDALKLMRKRPQLLRSSFEELQLNLRKASSRRQRPKRLISIGHESGRIGGRAKPWSAIYEAMLEGDLPFWTKGDIKSGSLLIEHGSLDPFLNVPSPPQKFAANSFADEVDTLDAAELLNVRPSTVRQLRTNAVLSTRKGTRALLSARSEVEALCATYVSSIELAHRGRTTTEKVNQTLSLRGLKCIEGLWPRHQSINAIPLR